MYTIAVISQKGGAGKTTLAAHLAVEAERAGVSAAIIDLDPQASATGWADSRKQQTPAVVSAQATRLTQVLDTARNSGVGLAIIDTAPHSETLGATQNQAGDWGLWVICVPIWQLESSVLERRFNLRHSND